MNESTETKLRIALLNLKELYLYSEFDEVKRIGELIYKAAQSASGSSAPENVELRHISTISVEAKEQLDEAVKEAEEYVEKLAGKNIKNAGNYQSPLFKCKSDHQKCLRITNQNKVECWLLYLLCISNGFFKINIGGGE
jgi:hypothetical protein